MCFWCVRLACKVSVNVVCNLLCDDVWVVVVCVCVLVCVYSVAVCCL